MMALPFRISHDGFSKVGGEKNGKPLFSDPSAWGRMTLLIRIPMTRYSQPENQRASVNQSPRPAVPQRPGHIFFCERWMPESTSSPGPVPPSPTAWVEAQYPRVYAACYRRLRHAADAEDAAQDVFRKYIEAVARIRECPEGWLIRCAHHTCVDLIRRGHRRRRREADRAHPHDAIGEAEAPRQIDAADLVRRLLRELSDDDVVLLRRHLVDRVSQSALAAERGVSQQVISRRVTRARQQLRTWVREHVGTWSVGGAVSAVMAGGSRAAVTAWAWVQQLGHAVAWSLAPKAVPAVGVAGAALWIALPGPVDPADRATDAGVVNPHVIPGVAYATDFALPSGPTTPRPYPGITPPIRHESPGVYRSIDTAAPRVHGGQPTRTADRPAPVNAPQQTAHRPIASGSSRASDQSSKPAAPQTPTAFREKTRPAVDANARPSPWRVAQHLSRFTNLNRRLVVSTIASRRADRSNRHHAPQFAQRAAIARFLSTVRDPQISGSPEPPAAAWGLHGAEGDDRSVSEWRANTAGSPVPSVLAATAAPLSPDVWDASTSFPGRVPPGSSRDRLALHDVTLTADLNRPRGTELQLTGTNRFLGTVSGAGHIRGGGTAVFASLHSPGDSPAFVDVEGSLVYTDDARLHIELAGTADGLYDRLTVTGDVTLAGDLTVSLIDGYRLAADQVFTILDIAGRGAGRFANYAEGQVIRLDAGLPADPGWLGPTPELFITYVGGDGNDVALYTLPASTPRGSPVPEPSTAVVLLLAVFAPRPWRSPAP
jgi:RNA polymerase sigma factor (sigma-70 family)